MHAYQLLIFVFASDGEVKRGDEDAQWGEFEEDSSVDVRLENIIWKEIY